ncbi:hypothetical protein Tco_0566409 [Tanacetum coccineum]
MDWVKELCVKNKVNFVGLQETKMGSIDLSSVRSCWGNSNFDYVHSDSVGNSGGILCIWDPNSFGGVALRRSDILSIVRGMIRCPILFDLCYWAEVDGFDKLVRDSWNVAPVNKKNAIRNFMGKLKFLKDRIRTWLSIHRSNSRVQRFSTEFIGKYFQASEIAQKAKIKWAIEGDENVKFFHGSIKEDMEARISKRRLTGLWGIAAFDKSPGPDGFSFSFYRYFLHVIEKDVFEAVDYFFMYGENTDWICNSKFIALILNLDANMVNGSSSISLIAVLIQDYCLKYWANRLVVVLLDLGVNVEDGMVKNAGLSKRGVSCPLDSISDYMGTKVGVNMSRKLSLEWKWWTKCVICLSDGDETPFIARENSLFLSRVVVFGSMQIFHSPIFKYVRFELNKNAMLASKLNAFKFDISFRSKEREVDIEEMQLNSLVKFLGMTTLVPCEEVLRTWTFEKVIGRSFRWLNFERD